MEKYLKQVIEEYEKNIESGNNFYMDASVLMDIEEYYEKNGKHFDAERLMRFAEKLHPESEEVLVVKGYRAKVVGKWREGLDIIRSIPNQQNRDVQLFYAEWDVASGRIDKAIKRVEDSMPPTLSNDDYDWLLDLGEMLLDYGYHQRALKYLTQIPQNYSLRSQVDELIADAYYQMQMFDKSIEVANSLVDANPYDANSWAQLADIQQKCQKYKDCIQSCDYALAIDENNQRAMSLKVFATFALSDYDKGLALCLKYMHAIPNDYSIRMYAGEQLYGLSRIDEAEGVMQDALRLCPIENPDHIRIINDLVYLYIQKNEFDKAEEIFLSLCMLGNSLSTLHVQLGNICYELKKQTAALGCYYKAIHSKTLDETELITIIQQLIAHGVYEEAAPLWNDIACLQLKTSQPSLPAYLAYAMYKLNNKPQFSKYLSLAIITAPDFVVQLFCKMFNTCNLEEIIKKANEEMGA